MIENDERSVYPLDDPVDRARRVRRRQRPRAVGRALRTTRPASWSRSIPSSSRRCATRNLDTAGHYYLRYAQPRAFGGDVSDEERQQHGAVLDRAYAVIDGVIGAAIERQSPGDLLLVVSGFGMQPVGPLKHLAARVLRDPDVSGTHENAPDGFMLAFGTPVTPGRKQRGSIVDVTPTILYFLGVPIGRDMDGYARADLFTPTFTAQRPITFIPSHGR